VLDLPVGHRYGESSWGSGACYEKRANVNTEGRSEMEPHRVIEVFNEVMKRWGYPVEDQIELFKDSKERVADLQVAGRVVDATLNECYPKIWTDKLFVRGTAYLKIEWSVFSTLEKKVVLSVTTEGSTGQEVESRVGQQGILRVAIADALGRLAVSNDYRGLVDPPQATAGATLPPARLTIKTAKAFEGSLQQHLGAIREAVVTVTANKGSGSGFVIGADGKVVTAAHVVSGSKYVKVKTGAGKECYGEVAALSKPRDLALLQVDCGVLTALAVIRKKVVEGHDVFAIGTPLSEKLEFSVTKGVISGVREFEGLEYIQSDVKVLPGNSGGPLLDASGNAIGVTTSGVAVKEVPVGLNFFVPMADLEKYLPVTLE
jgi:S1-C subfamily serine protease